MIRGFATFCLFLLIGLTTGCSRQSKDVTFNPIPEGEPTVSGVGGGGAPKANVGGNANQGGGGGGGGVPNAPEGKQPPAKVIEQR